MSDAALVGWLFVAFVLFAAGIVARIALFKRYNSPDGERYRRMRATPFIPMSADEIAADEKRKAAPDA